MCGLRKVLGNYKRCGGRYPAGSHTHTHLSDKALGTRQQGGPHRGSLALSVPLLC